MQIDPISESVTIYQGATWMPILRWLGDTPTFKAIAGITVGLPTILNVPGHGLTAGLQTPIWIQDCLAALNTAGFDATSPFLWASVVDVDNLSVNIDTTGQNGNTGVLVSRAPVDLTGWTADQQFRSAIDSTDIIVELTTENGGITLGADGTIKRFLTDEATTALAVLKGMFILNLTDPDGNTYRFSQGKYSVSKNFPQS